MQKKKAVIMDKLSIGIFLGIIFAISPSPILAGEMTSSINLAQERAFAHSPRIKAAKAKLEASASEAQQAGAWLNPEFSFEMENFSGSGQFSGTNLAEYTYALSQKLEIGGKRSARSDIALRRLKAAQADYAAAKRTLKRDVEAAYMMATAARQNLLLAREQEELAKTVLKAVSSRVEAAREPEIQLRKAEVAYATASLRRQKANRDVQSSRTALAALWAASTLEGELEQKPFFAVTEPEPLSVYLAHIKNAPQMIRYQHLQEAENSKVSYEKAQNVPDPTVNLGLREFRESDEQALVAGISFPLPIFNQNKGNIKKAVSDLSRAEHETAEAKLVLEQQLRESWQTWQQAAQEATNLKGSIIPSAQQAFSLARTGYDKGRFPYLEVLDAQRTLYDARAQYHDALLRLHIGRSDVVALATPLQNKTKIGEQANDEN
jgi:outer membrane protein, heavy metal efflux system